MTSFPLLLLPGALGPIEGGDGVDEALSQRRATAVIGYRGEDDLAAVIARVVARADALGAERFDLLGQSYGGWIAQCVARGHPGRVNKLVLSHSFTLPRGSGWRFALARAMLRRLPRKLLAALLVKRAARTFAPVKAVRPELFERIVASVEKRAASREFVACLAAQQRCMAESLRPPFANRAPLRADLPVLIIESDNDALLGAGARAALRRAYPAAQVQRFARAGHCSWLVEPEAYCTAVLAFLD